MKPKLAVQHLCTYFHTKKGIAKAVDGVSFTLGGGETLGIVGESGCGKSVTALSIMRLVPQPPGKIESGKVLLEGQNLLDLAPFEMRKIRGSKVSMVFQDPMTSLNPVFKVGEQVAEVIRLHQVLPKKEAFDKAIDMLRLVGIPSPNKRAHDYPHQMSGGMRQRVMIAMALSCRPKLMIADEPTTALDVTIQAQILDLIQKLKEETGTSIIWISHDMGVIAETAQNVIVMYAGKVMEQADVRTLFRNPYHPYTDSLLKSIPRADRIKRRLNVIPGVVPSLLNLPSGCKFNNRCIKAFDRCFKEEPKLIDTGSGHLCRCWLFESNLTRPSGNALERKENKSSNS
jgi:peptide/nickel transport system ATP-binding protein/oligopeptide transport system ATP-binding protein